VLPSIPDASVDVVLCLSVLERLATRRRQPTAFDAS
jgi:hypothetical protein